MPAFTSPASATFQVGVAGTFTITAIGVPTLTLALTGTLPSGLTYVDHGDGTATIAGTPAAGAAGSYTVSVNATNDLTDPVQTLVVVVAPTATPPSPTPTITDAATAPLPRTVAGHHRNPVMPLLTLAVALIVTGAAAAARRRRA